MELSGPACLPAQKLMRHFLNTTPQHYLDTHTYAHAHTVIIRRIRGKSTPTKWFDIECQTEQSIVILGKKSSNGEKGFWF